MRFLDEGFTNNVAPPEKHHDQYAKEAGGRTARELAELNGNQGALDILNVLAATAVNGENKPAPPTRGTRPFARSKSR